MGYEYLLMLCSCCIQSACRHVVGSLIISRPDFPSVLFDMPASPVAVDESLNPRRDGDGEDDIFQDWIIISSDRPCTNDSANVTVSAENTRSASFSFNQLSV